MYSQCNVLKVTKSPAYIKGQRSQVKKLPQDRSMTFLTVPAHLGAYFRGHIDIDLSSNVLRDIRIFVWICAGNSWADWKHFWFFKLPCLFERRRILMFVYFGGVKRLFLLHLFFFIPTLTRRHHSWRGVNHSKLRIKIQHFILMNSARYSIGR
jgi:hypothetical protein